MWIINRKGFLKRTEIPEKAKKTLRIAVDFDGVVTNPHKRKKIELNRLGYSVSEAQSSRDYCVNVLKISIYEYRKAATRANVKGLLDIPLEKDAKKALNCLRDEGIQVYLVTSRMDDELKPLALYLRKHDLKVSGFLNSNEKSKIEVLLRLQADLYIDDSISKIFSVINDADYLKGLSHCHCCLFRNEANEYIKISKRDGIDIVSSWKEIVLKALEMTNELKE
jgi:uncharacterized HAD superfamily protein